MILHDGVGDGVLVDERVRVGVAEVVAVTVDEVVADQLGVVDVDAELVCVAESVAEAVLEPVTVPVCV